MREQGGGSMVHICSDSGIRGIHEIPAYSVTKAGAVAVSELFAAEGAPHGIRANAVCPGDVVPGVQATPVGFEHHAESPGGLDAAALGPVRHGRGRRRPRRLARLRRVLARDRGDAADRRRRRGGVPGDDPCLTACLNGRRALVTGAARGIGFATARRFCEHGASVALCDVRRARCVRWTSSRGQGHTAFAVPFDVADEDAVEAGVAEARERLGGLDVLVANAGIVRFVPALDTSLELWRQILDVNLTGVFLCLRAAGRVFREQGHGVLLATSSQAGLHGYRGEAAYCASKFGVVGLVEVMAKELAPHGVRVNCVAPGTVDTPMQDIVVEEFARRARRRRRGGPPGAHRHDPVRPGERARGGRRRVRVPRVRSRELRVGSDPRRRRGRVLVRRGA